MQFEEIYPAFLPGQEHEAISSKTFQQMLYSWFEEKGLVADLRSYLRVQMINKLKNIHITPSERTTQSQNNFTLSKQAFNLIIGEHLLREGCHYTLSIFSTEISPLGQFPFKSLIEHKIVESKWRFEQECIYNILELIGINKRKDKAKRIASMYEVDKGSLLFCIINEAKNDIVNEPEIQKHIEMLLTQESLKSKSKYDQMLMEYQQELTVKKQQLEVLRKKCKKLKDENRNVRKHLGELLLKEESNKIAEKSLKAKIDELDHLQQTLQVKISNDKQCLDCKTLHLKISEVEERNKQLVIDTNRLEMTVTSLMKDLEQGRNQIGFLRSCLDQSNQMSSPYHQPEIGGGDDNSSDSNVTEEILEQVKVRLKNLERESEELDKRFRHLKVL